jgi:hypothetical protein
MIRSTVATQARRGTTAMAGASAAPRDTPANLRCSTLISRDGGGLPHSSVSMLLRIASDDPVKLPKVGAAIREHQTKLTVRASASGM